MQNETTEAEPEARKKFTFKKKWIALLVLVTLVVAAVVAVMTGWVAIVFKNPTSRVVVQANVCDSSFVKRFNDAMARSNEGYEDVADILKGIVSDIDGRSGNEKDPNCAYIRYRSDLMQADFTDAQNQVNIIQNLAKNGSYVSSQLTGAGSVEAMSVTLQAAMQTSGDDSDDN